MFKTSIFLILLCFSLEASNILNKTYFINHKEIKLSYLIPNVEKDFILFRIQDNKHSKRIKTKELVKTLSNYGYNDVISKHRFTTFKLKSPIDTTKIKRELRQYYKNEYPNIRINKLNVEPRAYLKTLSDEYVVLFKNNSFLRNRGTLSIKTTTNKKIFFNYYIDADIEVYKTKKTIKKGTELSVINLKKEHVILDKFRAKPIQNITKTKFQAKHQIKKNRFVTIRDISTLNIVKRGSNVNIRLNSNNMAISFSARALQNGKLNDIIKVQKANGIRLKVKVIGRNMAEMQ